MYRFGRNPPVHTQRTMRLAIAMHKALDALGPRPQTSNDYVSPLIKAVGSDLGMMGNDDAGDCTFADSGHSIMLRTANVGQVVIPSTQDVLSAYSALTGYIQGNEATDQGAAESDVCKYMMTTGICGHKSAGTAPIDPTNLDHVARAVQLFGTCRLGIVVGQDSIQQFDSGQPWSQITTDPNAGDHDVPAVYFDADGVHVITWGGIQVITWGLMLNPQFLQEAHGEVYPDWMSAKGSAPSGFDVPGLLGKLSSIESAQA